MLSKPQIERMVDSGMDERLIRRVLGNGRGLDAGLLLALLDKRGGAAMRAVALALAIERLDELIYGPDATLNRLVRSLLLLQDRWGRFPGGDERTMAIATAAAVGALIRRKARAEALDETVDSKVDSAAANAAIALKQMQSADGLFAAELETSEIILWLLSAAASEHEWTNETVNKLRNAITVRDARDPWNAKEDTSLGALALACAA